MNNISQNSEMSRTFRIWPKWCVEHRKFDDIGFQPEFIKDCTNQLCVFLSIPSISIKEK